MASIEDESPVSRIDIRLLSTPPELADASDVLMQVWGSTTPIVSREMLRAVEHSGGYVGGAYDGGRLIGVSFGWLAQHYGERAVHSHVTGLLAGTRHSGLGRSLKFHQREWARTRDITWITWTFDPLVRVNAWFNIEILGGQIAEYLPHFYGEMTDSINANDESDRALVAWRVDDSFPRPATDPDRRQRIAVPEDIVSLRKRDPQLALQWRHNIRSTMMAALDEGYVIVGFSRDGHYELERQL
jgi:predicted GNAT superfamily acetyltransferase